MTTQDKRDIQHGFLQRCEQAYDLVQGFLHDTLPWSPVPTTKHGFKYNHVLRQQVKDKVLLSMDKLEMSIDLHGLEEIAISYNGGKDCLVMLILLLATIHKKFASSNFENPSYNMLPRDYKLDSIFINAEPQFPDLLQFIEQSTDYYHLNPIIIKSSLKDGFEYYLNNMNTKVKSVIVGIRYSDPYGSTLHYEQPTDHDWPKFLRIHPILHWNYVDIWDFLIGCDLDYCKMYDWGYTSLGGINATVPNPYLKIEGTDKYLPAYMLTEHADERERLGRNKK
ncbi:uncharacterized protein SPAPADRAFT_153392 [Spathaspora passalidarum NRRL Y-27907]|uniref:FAD synthase n=1 Tax=Spathaspora passalidarum (strain NRRL Y-27907 / 11-Y1) TaxID=619300 RepID=G3AN34_SPAPN|nr:uncharacterized protein SPAPADRAFT_153392 [Spathaspora passalidarum NRRL Y-27907]EGW32448.1 hypothetical protein SPAPADRAFT_153392 [Spathaspora passalidarum NRRL Y-27907]